ncbi:hypothetical protein B0H14DRAFT_3478062 [Mycena olivaceomarginata]|nr:hypothetical protein B0H14DRAFT_3478062 [Mycena olivaceomarginata]
MNHPYTGAPSYIYANDRQYTPIDPRTKDPYGKRQSFVHPLDQHSRIAFLPPPPPLRTIRSTSLPGHTRPTPPMKMTPYEREGNPLSQRRSAFVPYDRGPPARKPRDSSGSVVRCGSRIRRALKQLKWLMSSKS